MTNNVFKKKEGTVTLLGPSSSEEEVVVRLSSLPAKLGNPATLPPPATLANPSPPICDLTLAPCEPAGPQLADKPQETVAKQSPFPIAAIHKKKKTLATTAPLEGPPEHNNNKPSS